MVSVDGVSSASELFFVHGGWAAAGPDRFSAAVFKAWDLFRGRGYLGGNVPRHDNDAALVCDDHVAGGR